MPFFNPNPSPLRSKVVSVDQSGNLALYNTSDQTTNYERLLFAYTANVAEIGTNFNGTGSARSLRLGTLSNATATGPLTRHIEIGTNFAISTFTFNSTNNNINGGIISLGSSTLSGGNGAGVQYGVGINPTINQTGNVGYTILDINPTVAAAGTGTAYLQRWAIGGVLQGAWLSSGRFGVNTGTPSSFIQCNGSFATRSDTYTADITVGQTNSVIRIDASGGNRTVTFPTASGCTGRIYIVKKIDSSSNTVSIAANGTEAIDGLTSTPKVIAAQNASFTFQSNGTSWDIIGAST